MSNWKKELKEKVKPSTDYSKYDLAAMIKQAKEHDACEDEIEKLYKFNSIEEALEDEEASFWCYWYAREVLKDRWIEAESIIIKDAEYAYLYARDVLKDRWIEAESLFMKSAIYAYLYAKIIIKDRWLEAESVIMKKSCCKVSYENYFNCKL